MIKARMAAVALGLALSGLLATALPAVAAAGSISGTVRSAATNEGIEGVLVCASTRTFGLRGGCAGTDGDGKYTIAGLQPAFYQVAFAEEASGNYVAQWYPGRPIREQAGEVEVQAGDVPGVDATLQVGGQISGRVADVATGAPIEDIEVCAPWIDQVSEYGVIHCDRSDAAGEYAIEALASGNYKVEFFVEGSPNYITQYYNGKDSWAQAQVLPVSAGTAVEHVDAALREGLQITGRVSEAGSGNPIEWVRVCALRTDGEVQDCVPSEAGGAYSLAGLPLGSYVVAFAVDLKENDVVWAFDGYVRQYFDRKARFSEANAVTGLSPGVIPGVDATLTKGPEIWPEEEVAPQAVLPPQSRPDQIAPRPQAPLRCRKGFRRKRVRGKPRCVKLQRKQSRSGKHRRASAPGR